jgi:hypothetical protein
MTKSNAARWISLRNTLAMVLLISSAFTACTQVMAIVHGGATPPPQSEFGLGPRRSSTGIYTATLQPADALKPRKMQTVQVVITDANSQPLDGAVITIDGGMPQHGHGLPTKPRVTRATGQGQYVIEGVRFNMGGWWEFKLAITGPAGTDTVIFNLSL